MTVLAEMSLPLQELNVWLPHRAEELMFQLIFDGSSLSAANCGNFKTRDLLNTFASFSETLVDILQTSRAPKENKNLTKPP